jgi:Tol biopolymer transport system component
MPSVAEVLDRESRTVDRQPGGFERLLRRRERKQRNRRLGAGALVLTLTVLATAVFLRAYRSEPTPANPSPSPTAIGDLVYAVDGDIYVAAWDGSNPVRIVDGRPDSACGGAPEYWAEGPIWSPDGMYLAYRQASCDSDQRTEHKPWWDAVISDREGNVVATIPSQGWRIAWSPDSTRVAVWDTWEKTIGIFSVHGVRRAELTVPPGMMASGDNDPVWMPDGKSVLVPNAVEIPLDGGPAQQLPWQGLTTFAPDGSHVAINTRGSLVVADADGSDPQRVFGDGAGQPIWSSAGDRIAFAAASARELHVVDVATGTVTLVARAETDSEFLSVVDFSPGGDDILFARVNNRAISLWSVHTDGSEPRQLIDGVSMADWQTLTSKGGVSTRAD